MRLYNGSTVYEVIPTKVSDGFGGYTESGETKNAIPCNISPIASEASKEIFGVSIENSLSMVSNRPLQEDTVIEVGGVRYTIKKTIRVRHKRTYLLEALNV